MVRVSSFDSATTAVVDELSSSSNKKQCRRRCVHFDETANTTYDDYSNSDDEDMDLEERRNLCWYSAEDMSHFKSQRACQVKAARRKDSIGQPQDNRHWRKELAAVYDELKDATSQEEIQNLLWQSSLEQPNIPATMHGMEKSIVPSIVRDRQWRRREVVAQVLNHQLNAARWGQEIDARDLKQAVCETSRQSALWAQYWARCVAHSCSY